MLLVDFSSFASMSIMAPFFPQQVSCSAKNLSHIAQLALYEGSCGTSFWGVQLAFFPFESVILKTPTGLAY